MRPVTILHTIETSGPGGAEKVLLTLASGLDPARFRSIIAINESGWLEDRLQELCLPFHRIHWQRWYDLKLPRALARLVRAEGVDVIHSHLPDQNFYSCIAGCMTGRPAVATYHGAVELENLGQWRNALKLKVVRNLAAEITVVCGHVGEMLLEQGVKSAKLQCIYNGIQLSKYEKPAAGKLRRELGLAPERPLIGMVANVRAPKGHEFFIRAARMVADRHPRAFFVICGDLHETLSPPLFGLVHELGLGERLKFLGFRSDVPELLAEMELFVLPSTSEGFPLVVLEAMAAGKPVIATRCGGVQEMIEHGVDGLLVPVGNAGEMANTISCLLSDPQRARSLGNAARRRVGKQFSVVAMVAAYERLYERCAMRPALAVVPAMRKAEV
jgi:glycosyltransferase involved in cell wall biosynthesis